jgi:hypothetical protein
MTRNEIEYMWKVASNDPNHDTNWNDAVVIAFAKLVAQHEREACAKLLEDTADGAKKVDPKGFVWQAIQKSAEFIRARGQA